MKSEGGDVYYYLKIIIFSTVILAVGIGLGRFLYTPILPVMLKEEGLNLAQLSYIASANYIGYLVGSLFFAFTKFGHNSHTLRMLCAAAIATSVLLFAMALTPIFPLLLAFRFAAGIASSAMMIFGSILVMRHTHNFYVIASLYAGVGAGILLGNEFVIAGVGQALNSVELWIGGSIISLILLLLLFFLAPQNYDQNAQNLSIRPGHEKISWWLLALLYGLAGFGYIIVATYLPLIAQTYPSPFFSEACVVFSWFSCYP